MSMKPLYAMVMNLGLLASAWAEIEITHSANMHFGELEFSGPYAYGEVSLNIDGSLWISSDSNLMSMGRSATPGHIVAKVKDVRQIKISCYQQPNQSHQARLINTRIYWVQASKYYRCGDQLTLNPAYHKEIELLIVADILFMQQKAGRGAMPKPLSIELIPCTKDKQSCL